MPVFTRDNISVLFVHMPKTGGGSIVQFFEDNHFSSLYQMSGLPPQPSLAVSPQHAGINSLAPLLNFGAFDLIFTIVRNPYERLLSEFRWIHRGERSQADLNVWINDSLDQYEQDNNFMDSHFRPMVDFLSPDVSCKVFKYEHGLDIISVYLRAQLLCDLNLGVLPRVHDSEKFADNKSIGFDSFSPDSIERINKIYMQDFLSFGYPLIDPTASPCSKTKSLIFMRDGFDCSSNASAYFAWHYFTLAEVGKDLNDFVETHHDLEKKVAELSLSVEYAANQNKLLLSERDSDIRHAREDLRDQILVLDSKCESLTNEMAAIKKDSNARLISAKEDARNQLNALDAKKTNEVDLLTRELDEERMKVKSLENRNADEVDRLSRELDEERMKVKSLENRNADEVDRLSQELDEERMKVKSLEVRHKEQVNSLDKNLSDANNFCDLLVAKLHAVQNEFEVSCDSISERDVLLQEYEIALARARKMLVE